RRVHGQSKREAHLRLDGLKRRHPAAGEAPSVQPTIAVIMNNIKDPDATEHYDIPNNDAVPSLLTVLLDPNPLPWAALEPTLPLSNAVANLLVFINGHLAFSNANQVAVLASHTTGASWLYPPAPADPAAQASSSSSADGDVDMRDAAPVSSYAAAAAGSA